MSNLYTLVMAGGQGTRFWPESTRERPKQYLKLLGDESLLEQTLKRFDGLVPVDRRYIVTVNEQADLVKESLNNNANPESIIFEPSGRNTGPCILLSLASLLDQGASKDDIVAIVPSDHVILNTSGFQETLDRASKLAGENKVIVTIGIKPNFPHTGYGYIQKGDSIGEGSYKVAQFKEKPSAETAKEYIATGNYYWNAGMFVAPIGVLMEEFEQHSPDMYKFFSELQANLASPADTYNQIPKDSIDYAVMEKSQKVMVTEALFDWNDLGSWDALESVIESSQGNTLAKCDGAYVDNASGNIVFTPGKFVGLVNVNDLIVISNDKAVVVLPKSDSQKVKQIVESLNKQ